MILYAKYILPAILSLFVPTTLCDDFIVFRRSESISYTGEPTFSIHVGNKNNTLFPKDTLMNTPTIDPNVIRTDYIPVVRDIVLDRLMLKDTVDVGLMEPLSPSAPPWSRRHRIMFIYLYFNLTDTYAVEEVYFSFYNMEPFTLFDKEDLTVIEREIKEKVKGRLDSSLYMAVLHKKKENASVEFIAHAISFYAKDMVSYWRGELPKEKMIH